MASRTVARLTAKRSMSSRSDGISASGTSSVSISASRISRSRRCLGTGPSAMGSCRSSKACPEVDDGAPGPRPFIESLLVTLYRPVTVDRDPLRQESAPVTSTIMSGEIAEQPTAVQRTLDDLRQHADELRALAGDRRHVRFVARGSSDNAAVYGRYLLETHAGCVAGLAAPSVATHYDAALDLSDTVVVSVSQSGGTERSEEHTSELQSRGHL